MSLFQIPSIIENITTRSDRTLKIVIGTQELKPDENSTLFSLHQKTGWLLFKENTFQLNDIPKENAKIAGKEFKSFSKRKRAVLFIYWKQKKIGGDFERFYEQHEEEEINKIKAQLN